MRKHPLIALTAFTALGTSALAGTTAGTFNSVLTSSKAVSHDLRPRRRSVRSAPVTAEVRPETGGGRDLIAAHDLSLVKRSNLDPRTGLPARPKRHHHRVRHHSVLVAAPAPPTTEPPTTVPVVTAPPTTAPPAPASPAGGTWYELRVCESGDNYAENTGNGYYGAYQFSQQTWYGLGYTGLPSNAPPSVQDQAAAELQARSGWGQWPQCAAELGLY